MQSNTIVALLLAAGLGTRLRPFTDILPKCLMPIGNIPLLEIWLDQLKNISITQVLVNLHYKKEEVESFLRRDKFRNWVSSVYEEKLLGTAGTLAENYLFFLNKTVFLAHSDNLCVCDFKSFFKYHFHERPKGTSITMMTFKTNTPESCGIVEHDKEGIVRNFHEKVKNPPGNLANAAIYLLEPEVIDWIHSQRNITDFSNQVLPAWVGKIATWENKNVMVDIGTPETLIASQNIDLSNLNTNKDDWTINFRLHPIHNLIREFK